MRDVPKSRGGSGLWRREDGEAFYRNACFRQDLVSGII